MKSKVHRWIEEIVALPAITPKRVGEIVGVTFAIDRESPYAVFYDGAGTDRLRLASLRTSKSDSGWGLELYLNFKEKPYFEQDLELDRYGAVVDFRFWPDTRPEAETGVVYHYAKHGITFSFTSATKRLTLVIISPQRQK